VRRLLGALAAVPAAAAAVLGVLFLAGCGIPLDDEPRAVNPPHGPYAVLGSSPPGTDTSGPVQWTLYLVRDGLIVPIHRTAEAMPDIGALIEGLQNGPTEAERTGGVGSALPGTVRIEGVRAENGLVVVTVAARPEGAGRTDEVLAYGQIVCSLDARPEVTGVVFELNGQRVEVPRSDGSLTRSPLTTADYESLLGHR
jgi:hypothetical protein